jgi:hypothetical protein
VAGWRRPRTAVRRRPRDMDRDTEGGGAEGSTFELGLVMVHGVLGTSLLVLPQVFCTAGVLMGASLSRQDSLLQPLMTQSAPCPQRRARKPMPVATRFGRARAAAWHGQNPAMNPDRPAATAEAVTHGVGARR